MATPAGWEVKQQCMENQRNCIHSKLHTITAYIHTLQHYIILIMAICEVTVKIDRHGVKTYNEADHGQSLKH
jgi:hypothetical protein